MEDKLMNEVIYDLVKAFKELEQYHIKETVNKMQKEEITKFGVFNWTIYIVKKAMDGEFKDMEQEELFYFLGKEYKCWLKKYREEIK